MKVIRRLSSGYGKGRIDCWAYVEQVERFDILVQEATANGKETNGTATAMEED